MFWRQIVFLILCSVQCLIALICISNYNESTRICIPFNKTGCRCHSVMIDGEGDSGCRSKFEEKPFCYVIDEFSTCSDKKKSSKNLMEFADLTNLTIMYSREACNYPHEKLGNEDYLEGIEIVDVGGQFFVSQEKPDHGECSLMCENRFFCKGWTFLESENGNGTCRLFGGEVCCGQFRKRKKNSDAISGFRCLKHQPDFLGCWSTKEACNWCPIEEEKFTGLMDEKWKNCWNQKKLYYSGPRGEGCYDPGDQFICPHNEFLALRDDLPGPELESKCVPIPSLNASSTCKDNEALAFSVFGSTVCVMKSNDSKIDIGTRTSPFSIENRACTIGFSLIKDTCIETITLPPQTIIDYDDYK